MSIRVAKTFRKITEVIMRVACILIFIFFIFSLFFKCTNVVSGSMIPIIKIGDTVLVVRQNTTKNCHEGDIVVYNSSVINAMVIHRVINVEEIDGQNILTVKGDANQFEDSERVNNSNIYGKVVCLSNWFTESSFKFIGSMSAKAILCLWLALILLMYISLDIKVNDLQGKEMVRQYKNMNFYSENKETSDRIVIHAAGGGYNMNCVNSETCDKEKSDELVRQLADELLADDEEDEMEYSFLNEDTTISEDDYKEEIESNEKEAEDDSIEDSKASDTRPSMLRKIDERNVSTRDGLIAVAVIAGIVTLSFIVSRMRNK